MTMQVSGSNGLTFPDTSTQSSGKQVCKAWVNFNGNTSPGTIRASYNVASVTKIGTGQYTVNFTNAMPDANYSVGVNTDYDGVGFGVNAKNFATGSFSVQCILPNLSNYTDHSLVNCQVFSS